MNLECSFIPGKYTLKAPFSKNKGNQQPVAGEVTNMFSPLPTLCFPEGLWSELRVCNGWPILSDPKLMALKKKKSLCSEWEFNNI